MTAITFPGRTGSSTDCEGRPQPGIHRQAAGERMKRIACTWAAGAALAAATPAAFAATRIDELAVRPNPAVFVDGAPPQVEIAISVERGQFDKQPCDVIVDTGDGAAASRLGFRLGDERT